MRWPWLVTLLGVAARADGFTVADLDMLDKQEAWDELGRHLEDIAPSKRDAHWQLLLEHAAIGQVASHDGDPPAAMAVADGFTRRFPTVKRSKDFMARRAAVGLAALAACLARADTACAMRFLDYAAADPANPRLALDAALAIGNASAPALAIPFFQRGMGGRKGKECASAALDRAVRAALDRPPDDPYIAPAQALAGLCWDALAESLVHHFLDAGDAYRRNTCGLLKDRKALTPVTSRRCN